MSAQQESRRARSARHYLMNGPLIGRLETTLALISRSMGFPLVRVNIVDEDSRHSIGLFGADPGDAISRAEAFCDTVVRSGRPLQVQDATTDPRFNRFPAVISGEIGAYLGVPLRGRESLIVGAVCVIDPHPRTLDAEQQARLVEFGRIVEDQLDLIRRLKEQRLEGQVSTTDLTRAIRDGEIVPWYQPVIHLTTGETVAFEALARWEHPSGAVEDPRRFVPMAEDSDLIIELDLAVIRSALTDLSRWHRTTPSLRMAVNLSARHFDHHDCVEKLLAAAAAAGVSPASVDLELTETMRRAKGYAHVAEAVHELQGLGFGVWLDDFGTGWSSLDHLLWLRVDGIKIDRAVTVALGTPIGDALTRAVTGLANTLGLRTTIEGIETQQSADLARAHGCDYGQGYLWAPPEPAASIDNTPHARPPQEHPGHPLSAPRPATVLTAAQFAHDGVSDHADVAFHVVRVLAS
jgi:EAL domain-containing protein (putative c-di-GMP-specific phosphodiesterase class I)